MTKHDQKTRHVGLAHVAQLRISLCLYFGEVFMVAKIRCCVRYWGPFGLAQLLGVVRRSRGDRPTGDPRFCRTSLGGADGDGTPSLPQEATGVSLPRMVAQERDPPVAVATSCDPPVVSGR